MVAFRYQRAEDQMVAVSIPGTIKELVNSACSSLGGVGKISSMTDGCFAWLIIMQFNSTYAIPTIT